ncbi:MAG: hypothetical protein OXG15_08305 [Gammaproteobacteria bacterium]|nr:hypothetical protein [Gammaproteobacteria bacterium]
MTSESDVRMLGPNEQLSVPIASGLGIQLVALVIPGVVLIPTIVFRGAGQPEEILLWGVFASVVVCGATTMLQAARLGRFGAGYLIATGTSGAAMAVSVAALNAGGPALLATLVLSLAIVQFLFSTRLELFRRILTPTVTGTIIMLTPVTVTPVIFQELNNVPEGVAPMVGPICALTTLAVVIGIMLKAHGFWRLWSPIIGVIAGALMSVAFGLYDIERVVNAGWIGFPTLEWPGLNLEFNVAFWALLPAFLFITVVCTIQTVSGSIAVQRVTWNETKAVDFRSVQGAVSADSVGNLFGSVLGSMPVGFRPTGTSMVEITGVGSRSLGLILGASLLVLACVPKALAIVLAIPGPVTATFTTIVMASIFIIGVKVVIQDGIDYRKGAIVGIAFWVGVGFEYGSIFPDFVTGLLGNLPVNGMLAGGLIAFLATGFIELTKPRRQKLDAELDRSALPTIRDFIVGLAKRYAWDESMVARLDAVSEETLLTLLEEQESKQDEEPRSLLVGVTNENEQVTLEFIASSGEQNVQDRMAMLADASTLDSTERDLSLRLLRHLASSVRHQQYFGTDVITVHVDRR